MSKRLVVHHDDIGGSHAANMAFADLWERQAISAGSVMVPCLHFAEITLMARGTFGDDLGVHLTLNAEFDGARWSPLTGVANNGLSDADGFFPKTVEEVRKADPAAVERELRAQIDTAFANGLMLTHLDTHMMALYHPEFISVYERLGQDYGLPIVIARNVVESMGLTEAYRPLFDRLEGRGNPVFDHFISTPFRAVDPKPSDYAEILDTLPDGLSYGAFHFAAPGADIEAMTDDATARVGDYRVFASGAVKQMLAERGIEMVGMKGL